MTITNFTLIENEKALLDICGVNDRFLKKIESISDSRIYTSGNEIYYDTQNPEIIEKLIKTLISISESGQSITDNIIETLYYELDKNADINFDDLYNLKIEISKSKYVIRPKTMNQALYFKLLHDKDMVFSSGPAGTGKTFIAIAYALDELLNKRTKKVILTRPVVEAGESLGYLPGDFIQKINPYLIPLFSSIDMILSHDIHDKLREQNLIEIAPLAYMRGRTFSDAIVILDEAQNTTYNQMKLFLTRPGENSKLIINGDLSQIDLPKHKNSGMLQAINILKHIKEIGFIEFNETDVIRHPLVKKILAAYNKHENS